MKRLPTPFIVPRSGYVLIAFRETHGQIHVLSHLISRARLINLLFNILILYSSDEYYDSYVKLPGGVELNGRQMFDDAGRELERIRERMSVFALSLSPIPRR